MGSLDQARLLADLLLRLVRHLVAVDNGPIEQLPVGQLRVCGELYRAPRAMSALSQELGVSLSAMTQTANRLERAGLVRRVADRGDRRVKLLRLTAQGKEMIHKRAERRARRMASALACLTPDAQGRVQAALEELLGAALSSSARVRGATRGSTSVSVGK